MLTRRPQRVLRLAVAAALLAGGAVATTSHGSTPAAMTEQAVVDQLLATAQASLDEPIVGLPPAPDVVAGRLQVLLDPNYWTNLVNEAAVNGVVIIPTPIDLVRPEMYLPTTVVPAGKKASPLPKRPKELLDTTYEWKGRTKTLQEFINTTETDGIAFVHKGAVVTDAYANGWSADVQHQPWSVTKSFVSALVGIARDERRVRSLQDPIESYIPELKGTAWQGTTLQNLLEMESGVHWDEGTPVLAVNTQVQQWIQLALDNYTGGAMGQTRNEFLMSLPRVAPQGTTFSYNSGNTQVLAWMLERIYKKPFADIISTKLWKPAGMAHDARVMTDRLGDAVASQGLYSRIFDLARFGELFRNGGVAGNGRRIVSQEWVRESTTMNKISDGHYAYQWWVGAEKGDYTASGFEGQKITVSPKGCLTGVRLAHQLGGDFRPTPDDDPASPGFAVEMGGDEWFAVYRAVSKRLGGC